jgi:hypothetical protein
VTAGGRTLLDQRPGVPEGSQAVAIGHARLAPSLARLEHRFRGGGPHAPGGSGSDHSTTPYPKAGRELRHVVEFVLEGTTHTSFRSTSVVSSFRVAPKPHVPAAVMASVAIRSDTGANAGQVTAAWWAEESYGGAGGVAATRQSLQRCDPGMEHCRTSTLPDGSLLRTTSHHVHLSTGVWELNLAEHDVDGVVEVLVAYAPRDAHGRIIGPPAPLSVAQLTEAVSHLTPLS